MCLTCGCDAELSKVEKIKEASRALRGTIADDLAQDTATFEGGNVNVLKFHGIYQQEDRDRRKEARKRGLDRHYQMMIRTRIPGGRVSPEGYLAHDEIADRWGNGTVRVTTRQDFQLHGVLKGDLWSSIHAITESLMTTLGGCGDQVRNVMCCPAPLDDRLRTELRAALPGLVDGLTPVTRAYHEIWIDGQAVTEGEPEPDPLYGTRYLPRKFKVGLAVEGDNCIDVYSHDLGLVAMRGPDGGLEGFTVLVGGGLGRTNNKPDTFPAVGRPLAFVPTRHLVETARAVVAVQRDYGNRADRRHARLKYVLAERGLPWFREQVQSRLPFELAEPRQLRWEPLDDHLGWHEQGDGLLFYGLFIENGRIRDDGDLRLKTALRQLVQEHRPVLWMTAQQNLIIAGVDPRKREGIERLLTEHGVPLTAQVSQTVRNSMGCPAIPTCGLAVAESERVLPDLSRRIERLVAELGLADEHISFRMTGCPNGCARPYLGDVGFVGTTLGKYDVFLGGDFVGTRLNSLFAHNVALTDIPALLRGPLAAFATEREPGEGFGDWCHRAGLEALRERFSAEVAPA
ncbi:MAG TPA: NADPH-dependent assimilatory sulfite reductase hemoprotein subunit [Candidatus Dormibacteraeota bacterium]